MKAKPINPAKNPPPGWPDPYARGATGVRCAEHGVQLECRRGCTIHIACRGIADGRCPECGARLTKERFQ